MIYFGKHVDYLINKTVVLTTYEESMYSAALPVGLYRFYVALSLREESNDQKLLV